MILVACQLLQVVNDDEFYKTAGHSAYYYACYSKKKKNHCTTGNSPLNS